MRSENYFLLIVLYTPGVFEGKLAGVEDRQRE
jgi:hypothetical protein